MAIEVTEESNTNVKVIRGSAADLRALIASAAGVAMPDFGEGEADKARLDLYDGVGGGVATGVGKPDAHFIMTLTDEEPLA